MDGQLLEPTLYTVKGMAILDNDGNRILAKYYDKNIFPTSKEEKTFEKNLFNKTHRSNTEIIMLDGLTCVYRSNVDLYFYVMGSCHENELILMTVLNCLYDSVSQILRRNVEKRAVFDSLDIVMLAMDEICDGGIILDADPVSVVQRVALRTDDIPLGEQTVAQVLQSAKEQLKWSLLKCCFTALEQSATVTRVLEGFGAKEVPHVCFICYYSVYQANEIMPARKGAAKRAATAPAKGVKPAKVIKKKEEFTLRPDLRGFEDGGFVLAVGQGDVGQLGLGTQFMEKMRPTPIPECKEVVCIAAGGMHSVCLTKAGTILTFGCNDEGALGRDTSVEDSETTPGLVELDGKAVQVTAGDSHSAALLDDGRVFAWGSFRDSHGNMGLTSKGNERTPVQMLPGHKVVKIASGSDHLIFLTETGRVYTCGCAEQGQLGRVCPRSADRHSRRGTAQLLIPSLVQFDRSKNPKIEDIWAGSYCTFAKTYGKGEIHVFGLNNYHQLGIDRTGVYPFPCKSSTFDGRKWKHISSGPHHTLALDEAGQVFVLGRKEYGRLGLGENCEDAKELTSVPTFNNMKCIDVATGSAQSFAVTDAGELYAWGMGSNGQLGTGEEDDAQIPVVIKSKQWIKEKRIAARVAGGGQHTLILATNSSVTDANSN